MAKARTTDKAKAVHAPGEPVYTMMAFVTLVAIALGCILLYLDYDEYGQKTAPAEKVPPLANLGAAVAGPPPVAPPAMP